MFPRLCIDLTKIAENVRRLRELCASRGIEITGITKAFASDPKIAAVFLDNGIKRLGDSRLSGLLRIGGLDCEKWLIRMPGISQAKDTVKLADVSLNSELCTVKALEKACRELNKSHKVVLMYDLGDLREGFTDIGEIERCAQYIKNSDLLELYGIGTNLGCLSFVQPDTEKLRRLTELGKSLGAESIISGGNSATLDLMLKGGIPEGVNMLRLGEGLLFGRERAHYKYLEGTRNDAFILQAEIIELKEKPSLPWGEIGADSYGKRPVFTDRGIRKRAICALGRADTDVDTMWPLDEGIEIIGASSDHLVLDVTEARKACHVGDIIELRLGYHALTRAFMSACVEKAYR